MRSIAIIVIAIGEQHQRYWQEHAQESCRAYANRHGYDVIIITSPLDKSTFALCRSPAWQKCLVLSQEFAARYEQIILLDCDVVMNAAVAPPITDQVPPQLIGGVISGSHVANDLQIVLLSRLRRQEFNYDQRNQSLQSDQDSYYRHFGLAPQPQGIVQTGVLVASPAHHRELFESVYHAPGPRDHRSFEQVPLSHAVLSSGHFRQIDSRFNSVFYETMLVYYPYLNDTRTPYYELLASLAVQTQLANNFFLHFAYIPHFAAFLPSD